MRSVLRVMIAHVLVWAYGQLKKKSGSTSAPQRNAAARYCYITDIQIQRKPHCTRGGGELKKSMIYFTCY